MRFKTARFKVKLKRNISCFQSTLNGNKKLHTFDSPYKTSYTDNGFLIWIDQYGDTTAFRRETVGGVIFTLGLTVTNFKGTRNELVILLDEKK